MVFGHEYGLTTLSPGLVLCGTGSPPRARSCVLSVHYNYLGGGKRALDAFQSGQRPQGAPVNPEGKNGDKGVGGRQRQEIRPRSR